MISEEDGVNVAQLVQKTGIAGFARAQMTKQCYVLKALLRTMIPDRHFDWKKIHYIKIDFSKNSTGLTKEQKASRKKTGTRSIIRKAMTTSRFGIRELHDRRPCFAGRVLRGFSLPKSHALQTKIIHMMILWYSFCIGLKILNIA